jgi:hypothetical protein
MERHEADVSRRNVCHGSATDLGAQPGELCKRGVIRLVHQNLGRKHPGVTPPTHEDACHSPAADKPDPLLCVIHVALESSGV